MFASGTLLNLTGFVANASTQPGLALWAIRLLIGPFPAILLLGSVWFAYRYPINRHRHQQILAALRDRRLEKLAVDVVNSDK